MTFLISSATAIAPEFTRHADALATLEAGLDLRERGCRRLKITDIRNGKAFSLAEFARLVGASSYNSA